MDASKPRPEPRPEPGERPDVRVEANRCPFCREGVEAEENVVCNGCLTRHHPDCWSEGGSRCSSCGGTERLEPQIARPAPPIRRLSPDRVRVWRRRMFGFVVALVLLCVAGLSFNSYRSETTPSLLSTTVDSDGLVDVTIDLPLGSVAVESLGLTLTLNEVGNGSDLDDASGYLVVTGEFQQGSIVEGYVSVGGLYDGTRHSDGTLEFDWRGSRYRVEAHNVRRGTWVPRMVLELSRIPRNP